MSGIAVEFQNVSKRFVIHRQRARSFQDALVNFFHQRDGFAEEFWALRNVSFQVLKGQTLGIIGQNGSGKSTILKSITRILEPTEGKISVNGRVSALIELGAGFHPDLSGRENIYLNGSILGFSRKDMDRRFKEIVDFSELESFIDTPVKHYSSGMYMRLGFSVAISVDPDILIIDEVLAVGDESFQRKCLERIDNFRRHGKTIIIVSHSAATIDSLCDSAIWLDGGILKAVGTPRNVLPAYEESLRLHDARNRAHAHELPPAESAPGEDSVSSPSSFVSTRVIGIQMCGTDGAESYSYRTGDFQRFRISYQILMDRASEHVLTLQFRRSDGLLIAQRFHRIGRMVGQAEDETEVLDVELPACPLLSGVYDVEARVTPVVPSADGGGYVRGGCRFSMWGEVGEDGLIALPLRWNDAEGGDPFDSVRMTEVGVR